MHDLAIDHIGLDFIVMHYGIGWGKRQGVFPRDFLFHEHFDNKLDFPESPHRP